ncbi:SNARE complex subunit Bet1 [Talaromyces proteolyticus]|uniref:SNARE complex subunit Bet1 n=1 Tax=Talaromyces proteolyticus TaxID=1131652 RepID=A0AAD4L103_9EURO|nr:SNARE complex subunit Bet1 [Talaromyces proteolyticus]KAH8704249.1 SNARE complex subunit Bet1 [Talaromyces proteolyticus]
MASRFPHSNLHQRDPRAASSLFDSYGSSGNGDRSRPSSRHTPSYGAYSGAVSDGYPNGNLTPGSSGYRAATPNSRGHYSDSVLSELESQNDNEVEGITAKVRALKELTVAIGDEIRSSSSLAESMNEAFDNTRVRLRGTMNRMLRMAERTGVGWRVWLLFFLAVFLLFAYVWLF